MFFILFFKKKVASPTLMGLEPTAVMDVSCIRINMAIIGGFTWLFCVKVNVECRFLKLTLDLQRY